MNFNKEKIENLIRKAAALYVDTKDKVALYLSNTKRFANEKIQRMDEKIKNIDSESVACTLKNVHFNFHHFVSVVMVALFAFLVTFYTTSFNTNEVAAAGLSVPESAVYNKKPLNVSYGDTKEIANVAKDILKEEVSAVSEFTTISASVGSAVYSLEDYIVTVELDQISLGQNTATLTIEDKNTYEKDDSNKVSIISDDVNSITMGNSYTYHIALNIIDTQAPIITLKESEITIQDEDDFNAKDYVESVIDNVDGSIDFTVEGEIAVDNDKYAAGEYTLIFRASDSSGNACAAELKVIVEESKKETVSATSNQAYGSYGESAYAGSVVAEARAQIGKAYVYGASGPNAFDCSGLVQYVYARSGVSIPRTSGGQANVGVAIDPNDVSQWRAGDIVTFGPGGSSHAAIYSGSGTLIHALNPSQGVRETGIYGFGTIYSVRRVQ